MGAFLSSASPDGKPVPDSDMPSGQDTGPDGSTGPDDNPADQQEQR
jgi:hypothetical protein